MKIEFTNNLSDIIDACEHRPKDPLQPGHFLGGPILLALLPMIAVEMLWLAANAEGRHFTSFPGFWSWLNSWPGERLLQSLLFVAIITLSWAGVRFSYQPVRPYTIWRKNRYLRETQTVLLTNEAVEYTQRGFTVVYKWNEFRHYAITFDTITLYLDKGFLCIPKRSIRFEEELKVAEALVARYARNYTGGFPIAAAPSAANA